MENKNGGRIIQSVQRAIDIINCFEDIHTELSLGAISSRLGLNKSTVHGIIETLCVNDYLCRTRGGKYMIGDVFANKYRQENQILRTRLVEEAKVSMNHIANMYHMNCSLFIKEHGELVLANKVMPQWDNYRITTIQDSYINPLYCTASGKILISYMNEEELKEYVDHHTFTPYTPNTITTTEQLLEALDNIRRDGYSVENEELGIGFSALSVPLLDYEGNLFGTISTTGLSFRLNQNKENIARDLKELSNQLTKKLF